MKTIKDKWVAALRGGKYKQGKDLLYNAGTKRYCCLGVLLEVCGESIPEGGIFPAELDLMRYAPFNNVGIGFGGSNALANLNDEDVPFEMIAGLIDEAL